MKTSIRTPFYFLLVIIGIFKCYSEEISSPLSGELKPWTENPWYWSFNDEPALLVGGSDDDNLFQWPEKKLIRQLDKIKAAGGNVVRNTMSDRKDGGFEVYPFLKLVHGKYDLDRWNPTYWQRFEFFLKETAQRHIFVQIEIWDRFDYTDNRKNDPKRWENHPYAPKNNINYTAEETGLKARYPNHPGANDQPFFFTTPSQKNIVPLLKYQKAFVSKLLQVSFQYDHVLYCIDNETRAEAEWGRFWAEFIKAKAKALNKTIMTTEMWDDWDLTADRHKQTLDHPEIYDFADISQNNHNKGIKHWNNFIHVKNYVSEKKVRPLNTTKTYGATGNKFGHSDQDAIERFLRHLLGGVASARFHRPDSGLGINSKAMNCIRAVRKVESIIPFWDIEPAQDIVDHLPENLAYGASNGNNTWVVYLTTEAEIKLALPGDGEYLIRWISADSGRWLEPELLNGPEIELNTPSLGNQIAVIQKIQDH